jgi:hypothetical protein
METAIKAGGRFVTPAIWALIDKRVDGLEPVPARLLLREELYQVAVDLCGCGFQEPYVLQRVGAICNAFAAIERRP